MKNENNNVIDHPNRFKSSEHSERKKPNYFARRLGAGAAVLITAASSYGIIKSSVDYMNSDRDSRDIPTQTEIATPGDTVWEMTDEVKNVEDRRDVIDWSEKNSPDLEDKSLDVGDEVNLPVDAKDIS